eukprot:TRINITY_DN120877_c0_g1_i1.p1 TRINITY_DN120877_c0_g1~~TRINITY_DN120877_c0_g1_i1.p1  ORF type:complete len:1304 (+),score=355.19 TRINITY_DN120877_c0_g1_i1:59-3913(+)
MPGPMHYAPTEEVLHQGYLGVKRKRGLEPRYFALYEDRLDYYKSEKDVDNGEVRGRVTLDEIVQITPIQDGDGEDGGISIQLEDQQLDLIAVESKDMRPWVDKLQDLIGEDKFSPHDDFYAIEEAAFPDKDEEGEQKSKILQEGVMGHDKKGKITDRYFILYGDCLEYYEDVDCANKQDPRGRVMVEDISKFDCVKGKGFSIYIVGEKKPLELRAKSADDYSQWYEVWRTLLEKSLASNFTVTEGDFPAGDRIPDSSDMSATEGFGEDADGGKGKGGKGHGKGPADVHGRPRVRIHDEGSSPRSAGLGQEDDGDGGQPVCEGHMAIVKNNARDVRYVVLWPNRFEYYNSLDDLDAGKPPRCRLPLAQLTKFEAVSDGYILDLDGRQIQIKAVSGTDLDKWTAAWQKVDVAGSSKDVSVTAINLDQQKGASREPSRSPTAQSGPQTMLMDGIVSIRTKGKTQRCYFRLFNERFEYFASKDDLQRKVEPIYRGRIVDVGSMDVTKSGFLLKFSGKVIDVGVEQKDLDKWAAAWQRAAEFSFGRVPTPSADSPVSSPRGAPASPLDNLLPKTPPQAKQPGKGPAPAGHGAGNDKGSAAKGASKGRFAQAASSMGNTEAKTKAAGHGDSDDFAGKAIYAGQLSLTAEGAKASNAKPRSLYLVIMTPTLTEGAKLQFFDSKEAQKNHEAEKFHIMGSDIRKFKVTDESGQPDGFSIGTDTKTFKLKVQGDLEDWVNAFRDVFKAQAKFEARMGPPTTPTTPRNVDSPASTIVATPRNRSGDSTSDKALGDSAPTMKFAVAANMMKAVSSMKGSAGVGKWSVAEVQDPQIDRWIEQVKQREKLVHSGCLGVQPKNTFVVGYFALFQDRLDFWNKASDAYTGQRPCGRLQFSDVQSYHATQSGFMLMHKGQRLTLFTQSSQDQEDWAQAMLFALPDNVTGESTVPWKVKLTMEQSKADALQAQLKAALGNNGLAKLQRVADSKSGNIGADDLVKLVRSIPGEKAKALQDNDLKAFMNALGHHDARGEVNAQQVLNFIAHGGVSLGRGGKRAAPVAPLRRSQSLVPRVALLGNQQRRIFIDPESEAQRNMHSGTFKNTVSRKEWIIQNRAHGQGMVVNCSQPTTKLNGSPWKEMDLAGKVNLRSPSRPRAASCEPVFQVDKITGPHANRTVTPASPNGVDCNWAKVTHVSVGCMADPDKARSISPSRERDLPVKIGTEKRGVPYSFNAHSAKPQGQRSPALPLSPGRDQPTNITTKVTDTHRADRGWAQPYDQARVDKARSLTDSRYRIAVR